MTLLDAFTSGKWDFVQAEEIRRALAIAQAVEEWHVNSEGEGGFLLRRAYELLSPQTARQKAPDPPQRKATIQESAARLPPLPQRRFLDDEIMVYTRQQMLAYGRACREAAMEEAAMVAERSNKWPEQGAELAAAIRALKNAPDR